jgi:hypothetical protein
MAAKIDVPETHGDLLERAPRAGCRVADGPRPLAPSYIRARSGGSASPSGAGRLAVRDHGREIVRGAGAAIGGELLEVAD